VHARACTRQIAQDLMKDGKFQWPIEEQSILFPTYIDESSVFLHAEYIDG
jgi:hypothetical protein